MVLVWQSGSGGRKVEKYNIGRPLSYSGGNIIYATTRIYAEPIIIVSASVSQRDLTPLAESDRDRKKRERLKRGVWEKDRE